MDNFESHQDLPGFLSGAPVTTTTTKTPSLENRHVGGGHGEKVEETRKLRLN